MRSADTPPRGGEVRERSAAYRVRLSVDRHAKAGWFEWTLREFLRYLFGIGVLGLLVFVPLQMDLSWLPSDTPPIFDPSLVILLAVLAMLVIGVMAILAYRTMWGDGGWVDRTVARHRTASPHGEGPPSLQR